MSDDTRKEPVESFAEAARRLIGVMDERRKKKLSGSDRPEQIHGPDSASHGLSEDAARGGGDCLGQRHRRYMGRSERREMAGPRAEEGDKPSDRFRCERGGGSISSEGE